MRHLLDFDQMTLEQWQQLYTLAMRIKADPGQYEKSCCGKILATLFYEPSTRTQMSFQAAALRLGAQVVGFSGTTGSSVAKGENLWDTVRTVACYADLIVIRHPHEGAAAAAAMRSSVPVVNAGDGGHLHPTQTLTDLTTILAERGRLSGLTVGLCGDLKNGRTVHSLLKALARFPGNEIVLISTKALRIPDYTRRVLDQEGVPYREVDSLEQAIGALDVLYMTRIQKERFVSEEEYRREASVYVLGTDKLALAKSDLMVLHPLPKVDEITYEADKDPRCKYFLQAEYGMYIRMALLHTLFAKADNRHIDRLEGFTRTDTPCPNRKCVTAAEPYLPALEREGRCAYCEEKL